MNSVSFADIAIVSCRNVKPRAEIFKRGRVSGYHLFFTTPGLHEDIRELERQLNKQINYQADKP